MAVGIDYVEIPLTPRSVGGDGFGFQTGVDDSQVDRVHVVHMNDGPAPPGPAALGRENQVQVTGADGEACERGIRPTISRFQPQSNLVKGRRPGHVLYRQCDGAYVADHQLPFPLLACRDTILKNVSFGSSYCMNQVYGINTAGLGQNSTLNITRSLDSI